MPLAVRRSQGRAASANCDALYLAPPEAPAGRGAVARCIARGARPRGRGPRKPAEDKKTGERGEEAAGRRGLQVVLVRRQRQGVVHPHEAAPHRIVSGGPSPHRQRRLPAASRIAGHAARRRGARRRDTALGAPRGQGQGAKRRRSSARRRTRLPPCSAVKRGSGPRAQRPAPRVTTNASRAGADAGAMVGKVTERGS
jgi:hypothetical protein